MDALEIIEHAWKFIAEWYWIPVTLVFIGVVSTILIENRNPTKAVSWLLVITFLPIVGLILYYLFGQKFVKEKRLRSENKKQIVQLRQRVSALEPQISQSLDEIETWIGYLVRVFKYLKREKLSLPSLSSKVELLINGEKKFPIFLEDIRNAKHFIHLEYYIFDIDNIGMEVLNVLEERAESGVQVRLIADALGSAKLARKMRKNRKKSKIEFQAFLPITFTQLANSNYRNHRKIAVIDGRIGYVGGINIADKYINREGNFAKQRYWRDTAVRIQGEAVDLLQVNFWASWLQTDGKSFDIADGYLQARKKQGDENTAVSFCTSDPGSIAPHNKEALMVGINEAQSHIRLCTPYYIPSPELETALMIAVASGIEVELMLPSKGDSWIVQHASFSFIKPLLERGVKVYLYHKGFLHAKTISIDSKLAYVGTMNLDTRSFDINFEIMSIITNENLCESLDQQFEIDKQDSQLISLEDWLKRPRWKRGVDAICRLLAPLL